MQGLDTYKGDGGGPLLCRRKGPIESSVYDQVSSEVLILLIIQPRHLGPILTEALKTSLLEFEGHLPQSKTRCDSHVYCTNSEG